MKDLPESKTTFLCKTDSLSLRNTFECGQCFKWSQNRDGSYTGIAKNIPARLFIKDGGVYIKSPETPASFWNNYFDINRDYSKLYLEFCTGEFMKSALSFGAGLRILRQDPWEALCSFIISQCNNITRIKTIINTLSRLFGEKIEFEGDTLYSFPTHYTVAGLTNKDLEPLKAGYREKYILEAAKAVASGEIDLESLKTMTTSEAGKQVMKLNGVGSKVADCFLLFGLSKYDAFPVDTWIKKAIKLLNTEVCAENFGEYAGIAQQYIFYYARSLKLKV